MPELAIKLAILAIDDKELAVLKNVRLLRQEVENHTERIIDEMRSGKNVILIIKFTEYKT